MSKIQVDGADGELHCIVARIAGHVQRGDRLAVGAFRLGIGHIGVEQGAGGVDLGGRFADFGLDERRLRAGPGQNSRSAA